MREDRLNRIILALGSNDGQELHIEQASKEIESLMYSVEWASAVYTKPIECTNSSLFLNKVAVATTPLGIEDLHKEFKRIEKKLGRSEKCKECGLVPIDIDLLQWNDMLLKPVDCEREYIRNAISELIKAHF